MSRFTRLVTQLRPAAPIEPRSAGLDEASSECAPGAEDDQAFANHPGEEFAAPPANAAPKLTVQQALDAYTCQSNFQVPDGVSVSLGLLTRPIGPDIGPSTGRATPSSTASPTTSISDSPMASCATFAQPAQHCRTGRDSNGCSLMRTPASTSEESPRRPTGRAAPPTSHPRLSGIAPSAVDGAPGAPRHVHGGDGLVGTEASLAMEVVRVFPRPVIRLAAPCVQ